jgi:hypothetical protein
MERVHYWAVRYIKGGPVIGAKSFYGPPLVDGEFLDRGYRWQVLLRNETTARAIYMGEPCPIEIEGIGIRNIEATTRANYEYLVAHSAFSTAHAPENPDASPTEAVNFDKYIPI